MSEKQSSDKVQAIIQPSTREDIRRKLPNSLVRMADISMGRCVASRFSIEKSIEVTTITCENLVAYMGLFAGDEEVNLWVMEAVGQAVAKHIGFRKSGLDKN